MAKSQGQTASFMMLCINDFANKLWIPAKFVRKYSEISEEKSVVLKTDSEIFWDVKIEGMNGDLYMEKGWSEFVKDNEITDFDFLTFRLLHLHGRSTSFTVSVYGADGCPKRPAAASSCSSEDEDEDEDEDEEDDDDDDDEIIARDENVRKRRVVLSRGRGRSSSPKIVMHDDDDDDDDDDEDDMLHEINKAKGRGRPPKIETRGTNVGMNRGQSKARNDVVRLGSSNSNPLYIEICLKHHQKSRISLPVKFFRACSFEERKYVKMEFVASGYCKPVALDHRARCRMDLATGWSAFCKVTGLVVGKTYSFEYSPKQNIMRVKKVKKRSL